MITAEAAKVLDAMNDVLDFGVVALARSLESPAESGSRLTARTFEVSVPPRPREPRNLNDDPQMSLSLRDTSRRLNWGEKLRETSPAHEQKPRFYGGSCFWRGLVMRTFSPRFQPSACISKVRLVPRLAGEGPDGSEKVDPTKGWVVS